MSAHAAEAADLLDLRLLPAWVKEPAEPKRYEHHTGEEENDRLRSRRPGKPKRSGFNKANAPKAGKPGRGFARGRERRDRPHRGRHGGDNRQRKDRHSPVARLLSEITVRFLPYPPAFENVTAQIQSGSVTYSLFALARLFLEKPERYEVRLTAKPESPLFRLGDNGAFSPDREFLERNAFRFAHESFYKIDITQSEPIKGDFSNVARCRLSGTLTISSRKMVPPSATLNKPLLSRDAPVKAPRI